MCHTHIRNATEVTKIWLKQPTIFYSVAGDPTKHAELREVLISKNSHIFGGGWTIGTCSLKEHLAKVAKLGWFVRSKLLLHCAKSQCA